MLNHQRDLGAPARVVTGCRHSRRPPGIPSRAGLSVTAHAITGFAVAFEGGEIAVGATYPTVEWILKQRMFSVDDALARQPGADRAALASDLDRLERAGVIVATEMR